LLFLFFCDNSSIARHLSWWVKVSNAGSLVQCPRARTQIVHYTMLRVFCNQRDILLPHCNPVIVSGSDSPLLQHADPNLGNK
jgi:hypothetical protein